MARVAIDIDTICFQYTWTLQVFQLQYLSYTWRTHKQVNLLKRVWSLITETSFSCARTPSRACLWKSCDSSRIELTQKTGYVVLPLAPTCWRFLACRSSQSATVKCATEDIPSRTGFHSADWRSVLLTPAWRRLRAKPGRAQHRLRWSHCLQAYCLSDSAARESSSTYRPRSMVLQKIFYVIIL